MKIKKELVKEIIRLLEQSTKCGGSGARAHDRDKDTIINILKAGV